MDSKKPKTYYKKRRFYAYAIIAALLLFIPSAARADSITPAELLLLPLPSLPAVSVDYANVTTTALDSTVNAMFTQLQNYANEQVSFYETQSAAFVSVQSDFQYAFGVGVFTVNTDGTEELTLAQSAAAVAAQIAAPIELARGLAALGPVGSNVAFIIGAFAFVVGLEIIEGLLYTAFAFLNAIRAVWEALPFN